MPAYRSKYRRPMPKRDASGRFVSKVKAPGKSSGKGRRAVGQRAAMRRYANIDTLARATRNGDVSLDNLVSGRIYHRKDGWISHNVRITAKDAAAIAQALGGQQRTQEAVANVLRYGAPGELLWKSALGRIVYRPDVGWSYVAGQDYRAETARIRKALS